VCGLRYDMPVFAQFFKVGGCGKINMDIQVTVRIVILTAVLLYAPDARMGQGAMGGRQTAIVPELECVAGKMGSLILAGIDKRGDPPLAGLHLLLHDGRRRGGRIALRAGSESAY